MATQVGTTYQQVIGAVSDYYGAGSDQWYEIARHGIHSSQAESIISQVPGASVIKNNAGQITGFTYDEPFTYSEGGIAGEINSNLQGGTQANGNTFQSQIPASGTVNQQTGNIEMSSGAKKVSDGSVVPSAFSTVTTAIAGLAIGTRLGTNILERMYNGNPDYWDSVMPTINPQTWDSIAGTNGLGKSVLNAIFGINKNTGETQMYISEDAFAYLAYGMNEQGFFNDDITYPDYSDSGNKEITSFLPASTMFGTALAHVRGISGISDSAQTVINSFLSQYGDMLGLSEAFIGSGGYDGWSPVTVRAFPNIDIGDTVTLGGSGYPCHVLTTRGTGASGSPIRITEAAISTQSSSLFEGTRAEVLTAYYSGINSTSNRKEGTEKQPESVSPDTTNWNDIASTDQSLRQQYPDMYNNAIYTDVPQPDGTIKRIIYVPVNTTGTKGSTDTKPDNTTVTQNQTIVNNNSDETLLKTIIRYLTQTQSESKTDTPNPPNTPNPTDTGNGKTPPVVVPTGSASSLFAIYNPSQAQLDSFGGWLWSSNFVDQILKLFNDPMQAIIGLHKIFASPPINGTASIKVGYLDSGVSANKVSAQYTTINCGTVNVYEQFGNVFDYISTQVRLYLPFIGIVDLDTADVMRGSVNIVYHVDVLSGACLAEVKITRDSGGGTIYQYAGDCAVRYPISSGSYMGMVTGVLSVVGGIGSAIMSGGATLPIAASAVGHGLNSMHTDVQHSGSFSGCAGAMGIKKPYLIFSRPQTKLAGNFEHYQGYPANESVRVSSMSGYFKMADVHLNNISRATESELSEIENLLLEGVVT